jgi:hypothetical protein
VKKLDSPRHTGFVSRTRLGISIAVLVMGLGLLYTTAGRAAPSQVANRAQGIDDTEAARILGHALPAPRFLPLSLSRSAITADPPETNPTLAVLGPRRVHESFAIGGRDVLLLTFNRGSLGRILDPQASTTILDGRHVTVASHEIMDGSTDVAYYWEAEGLAVTMHINLVVGLGRELTDQIAGSVR